MFKAFIAGMKAQQHPRPYDDALKDAPAAVKVIAGIAGIFDFLVGLIIFAGTILSAAALFGKFGLIVGFARKIFGY